jgi:hypothetical protein
MAFLLSRIGLVRPRSEMIKIKSNQKFGGDAPNYLEAFDRFRGGAMTDTYWTPCPPLSTIVTKSNDNGRSDCDRPDRAG